MSDNDTAESLTGAAADTAAKSPAPAKDEATKADKAKAAAKTERTAEEATAEGDKHIADFQNEIAALRAELAAARGGMPQITLASTVDVNRARVMFVAQSEAAARASNVNDVPGGPVFSIPVLDPRTNEVKGYVDVNGKGERIKGKRAKE